MKTFDVVQGSPEWHAIRLEYNTASEAPAMMGASKYQTRNELLRQKATGIIPEVDAGTQYLFDRGHATEAMAREIVEGMIGEDLFPVTGAHDELKLLASFDGITMDGRIGFEHKLWNAEFAAQVKAGNVPATHYWQLEQQLLIGEMEKIIFVVSDGTRDNFEYCEYRPVPGRREALLQGWKQFEADLFSYDAPEVIPAATAAPIQDLPALTVEIVGQVTATNLPEWKSIVTARIQSINTSLQTDNDFATAEKTVKFLDDGEKKLDLVKQQAQSQASSIDELFRAIDDIKAEMRSKRLELDKLVKARKESIRIEILNAGKTALDKHLADLSKRLTRVQMPPIPADFAGVMKGKKTIASLRDAVDTELARAKIAANELADKIQINLATLEEAKDHAFLFNDFAHLVMKANDDLQLVIKSRIADHKEAEAKRLEAEREKIAAQERAKIEAKEQPPASLRPQQEPAPSINGPEIWKKAFDRLTIEAEKLTVTELELVTNYIQRKGWANKQRAA